MPGKKRVTYLQVAEAFNIASSFVDTDTEDHEIHVMNIVVQFAEQLRIKGDRLIYLKVGAQLHDIGKLAISPVVFRQASKLTRAQRIAVDQHPIYGLEIAAPIGFPQEVLDCIYEHQEHWDGSGYPRKLKGEEISLNGRIVCIADVWEAIMSYRPYRPHRTKDEAFLFMKQHKHWFDPDLFIIFEYLVKEGKI